MDSLHRLGLSETASSASLRKIQNHLSTLEQSKHQLTSLRNTARILCDRLSQQLEECKARGQEQQKPQVQLRTYLHVIQTSLSRVERASQSSTALASEKKAEFESSLAKFRLFRLISDLETWINEKAKVATVQEVGTDIDHCCLLREKFFNFIKVTAPDGTARVVSVNDQCDRFLSMGHPDAAEIASAKDSLNDSWADLLELIETRKQLLNAAYEMHHFVGDCQDIEERILFRINNLPEAPPPAVISGQKQGLSACHRRHAAFEQELECLTDQITRLASKASTLFVRYAGSQMEQLQSRHNRVQEAWQQLRTVAASRSELLRTASLLHTFLVTARELIFWLESVRDQMDMKEKPRDVTGVELLVQEHSNLRDELVTRTQAIDSCLQLGRTLLQNDSGSGTSPLIVVLPNDEVRERCVQLATGQLLVQELWRERWDRLHLLLEVRQFARDATSAEAWLASRELQLEIARRQLGETLSETLMLLGAHYAFEQTIAVANERFGALKRLTTLEVRAMEWKSEEAAIREQEKRDKIREVVKEFLPQYIRQTAADSSVPRGATEDTAGKSRIRATATLPTKPRQAKSTEKPERAETERQVTAVVSRPEGEIATTRARPALNLAVQPGDKPTVDRKVSTTQIILQKTKDHPQTIADSGQVIKSTLISVPADVYSHPGGDNIPKRQSFQIDPKYTDASKITYIPTPGPSVQRKTSHLRPAVIQEPSSTHSEQAKGVPSRTETASSRTQSESSVESASSASTSAPRASTSSKSAASAGEKRRELTSPVLATSSPVSRSTGTSQSPVESLEHGSHLMASSSQLTADQLLKNLPRLEGPVIRKHDLEAGGLPRSKSSGRGWLPLYLVLDSGQLYFYRDYRSRRQKPNETLRNESPIDLGMSRAYAATEYTKRPCVFRLILSDGRGYLFQTANDRALQRWVDVLNNSAQVIATAHATRASLSGGPSTGRTARSSSLRFESPSPANGRRRSIKNLFSMRRKTQQ
ncbi:unnamed protein product [Dicrocoelium dendriticum]|nr:unnamed protein product [Dicrocoelium dendriticum]